MKQWYLCSYDEMCAMEDETIRKEYKDKYKNFLRYYISGMTMVLFKHIGRKPFSFSKLPGDMTPLDVKNEIMGVLNQYGINTVDEALAEYKKMVEYEEKRKNQ